MLPLLHDEYDWIMKLHAQIGFQLQTESETAENVAAELSAVRCRQLIVQFLQDEGFDGELSAKSEDFYWAITNRLPFLSVVSGSDQEAGVLFPLRSIQEYFAAEWLISFDDEDKLSEALEIISVSAYWRNVYLFVAGFFTKHRERKNMNETLFRICQHNNGDENYESANAVAYRITMQGSWLALDLLSENLFSRPTDQRRYLNVAAKLLDVDHDALRLTQQLPSKIADIFLQEKVIPRIQKTKNAERFDFKLLWVMANNRNEKAYAQLENIVADVTVPEVDTISDLLSLGFDNIGEKAIHVVYLWITEERFTKFCNPFWASRDYWSFLFTFFVRSPGTEFSLSAIRQAVYRLLNANHFNQNSFNMERVSYPNRLLQKMMADDHLNELLFPYYTGSFGLMYRPIQHDRTKPSLSEYAEDFRLFQLHELAALVEFLHSPSYLGIRKLLEAYSDLPECCKIAFISLIRCYNWFLWELADRLSMSESEEKAFSYYDHIYVEACLKKDQEITYLIENADLVSITRSNYWKEIDLPDEITIPQDLMQEILSIANDKTINKGLISFLYATTESEETISPELAQFGMCYFPLLFQSIDGAELALKLFDQISLRSLISSNFEYPKMLQVSWAYRIEDEQANRLLKKIDLLAEFGEEFLQAYALLPHFFHRTNSKLLSKLMPSALMQYYHAINATGNQAALIGCILRILAGPISDVQKSTIWEKLLESLQIDPFISICSIADEQFSMDGKMLVYEAITTLDTNIERYSTLLKILADSILEKLEASPVERDELLELSKIAHSDRNFL